MKKSHVFLGRFGVCVALPVPVVVFLQPSARTLQALCHENKAVSFVRMPNKTVVGEVCVFLFLSGQSRDPCVHLILCVGLEWIVLVVLVIFHTCLC